MNLLARYTRWLHTRWPAGTVEPLPEAREDGTTTLPGVRIVGDLTGVPLLKLSADGGTRAVRAILAEPGFDRGGDGPDGGLDLAIVGAGVAGIAAAIEAKAAGLSFEVFDASEPFSTVVNFPKGKPIYTYPTGLTPAGGIRFREEIHPKETLLADLEAARRRAGVEVTVARVDRIERAGGELVLRHADGAATRARRVIVAIGRSGSHRRLRVPGEELDHVFNRLYDPKDHAGQRALVVGGGDSALETAIALCGSGAGVTLSYRRMEFTRCKAENVAKVEALARDPGARVRVEHPSSERESAASGDYLHARGPGSLALALGTRVVRIERDAAVLRAEDGTESRIPADVVFTMLGREAPLDFFRRSGIRIRGEWTARSAAAFAAFLLFCVFLYDWKSGGALTRRFQERGWFPFGLPAPAAGSSALAGTVAASVRDPGFWYSLAYCLAVLLFGIRRIRRRRTPYVTRQTVVLTAVQWLPLFVLPYVVLPWLGRAGAFDAGAGRAIADALFPLSDSAVNGREYWRAFGFILAWPLFVWNVFSWKPLWAWLAISFVQTFVLIPLIIRRWGKGAYCGWICSCGALAETMGDAHREKMPHGPVWNRVNMLGQAILAAALLLAGLRFLSWGAPGTRAGALAGRVYDGMLSGWRPFGIELNYYHAVDVLLAGIVGVGFYFAFSGRVWCRFACPLAALMHVYARFSRFRIFPEKARCISCNVCTSVCHQGIDVMAFANKGVPMEDPQCVRCSACVSACPTGVLAFGRYGAGGLPVLDRLPASPVRMSDARTAARPPA
jgi:NosR/NirI family nitrous oxide reductase transcriptional regulator